MLISTMAGIGARGKWRCPAGPRVSKPGLAKNVAGVALHLLPPDQCGLRLVDTALEKLEQATPTIKRDVLHASGVAVMHDGVLGSREAELLRAAADAIGCSIPPFVKA